MSNYEPYQESFDRIKGWAGHVTRMGERRGAYNVGEGKSKVKTELGRHRRRWEHNIKMDLQEVGLGNMDSIDMSQNRDRWRAFLNTEMNIRTP